MLEGANKQNLQMESKVMDINCKRSSNMTSESLKKQIFIVHDYDFRIFCHLHF